MTFVGRDADVARARARPVSTPRTPILWSVRPTSTPGQLRSTMKAVTESWARLVGSAVLANTVYQSASRTPDIQHLVPFRTQPPSTSGSGVARVRMPMTSLPAWGSDSPKAARLRPVGDAGQVALLLLLGPGDHHRPGGQPGQQQHERGGVGVLGHLLDGDGEPEDPRPRAAVLLGDAQAEQPGVAKGLEDVVGYSPLRSISRARGFTLSWARRRTVAWSSDSSGDSSKSIVRRLRRRRAARTVTSISTAPPRGNAATPMADRVWRPASPKTRCSTRLAPSTTAGCSWKSGVEATKPVTVRTRATRSSCRARARARPGR